ncbi:uncharacterized protein LOC107883107 [Acyrthosiphon pisum]|uniref:Gustatory receptor n=1 Tax=Acyrthosiphon pisum TaxID=7029 RepID=A0A8R2H6Y3_ACYPI|nr:uncharacterized protein LOC107883107 [Acyrthosiphon pisum]|eukprot:XP_016658059.1 PREDICTED: uncharacterized protein LOC107883107 [Acyrthosiphon pisum]
MTCVFHITLRPILFLMKCMGIIDISYTMESTGVLVENINSTFPAFLEISRMIVLLICTYIYLSQYDPEFYVLQIINILKFWNVIIAARLYNFWIIKFINGIIEFDQKIAPLSSHLLIPQRSWKKIKWDMIIISLFAYFIGFKIVQLYFIPLKAISIEFLVHHILFNIPFLMDYVVVISLCFFLQNIYVRFQTVNDLWKCLPADLVPVSNQWTHIEIVLLMENTRLLHAELCDLLKMFSLGYGPMLLGFFIFSFINMLISVYIVLNFGALFNKNSITSVFKKILVMLIYVQCVTFSMSIITFVSFINEKRLEMVSYLRLYRISNLHLDIKRQIKMFMNQISVCDSDQISAFGFFNINLNLVTSVLVLLISGTTTLIQMKDHPIILKLNNDTYSFFKN